MSVDYSEWNTQFEKLRYKHDTWYIFRDWLDLTIDGFTIPDQTPLFSNKEKYTKKEYGYFADMLTAYMNIMQKGIHSKNEYIRLLLETI